MDALMEVNSKNMSDVLESCLETVKERFQKTLSRTLKWTLHQTEGDAVSELARAELVFLMVVNSLANLDTEMSGILLKEVDRWSIFPRIKKYMSGKMDAEWRVPREMLDHASKFALILERSGLFSVPPELRSYLAQLLAEGAASGSGDSSLHEESKRPRKDPHSSPSQQVVEASIGGQASAADPEQERCYRLVARRKRSHKGGGGKDNKGKQAHSDQQLQTTPPQETERPATDTTPGSNKIQTSSYALLTDKPTGTIPKVPPPAKTTTPKPEPSPATGAFSKLRKVSSTACQTDERQVPPAVKMTSSASQTMPLIASEMMQSVGSQTVSPTANQMTLPAANQTTLPASKQTTLPAAKQTTLPAANQTTLPASKQTTLPAAKQTTLPAAKQTTLPTAKQTTLPAAKQTTLPAASQAPAASNVTLPRTSKKSSRPALKSSNVATSLDLHTMPPAPPPWLISSFENFSNISNAPKRFASKKKHKYWKKMTQGKAQRLLWEGVEEDDGLKVEQAIFEGADTEVEDHEWMTPLQLAAKDGRYQALFSLVEVGVDLEGRGCRTALHFASESGHLNIVRALLAAGANIEAKDHNGSTPLHLASSYGYLNIAMTLVEAGADIFCLNAFGYSPLALAERHAHPSITEFLLSLGANM